MTKTSGRNSIKKKNYKKLTKGYSSSLQNSKQFIQSFNYAFIGRKKKKQIMRSLWILRLNAMCKIVQINYSNFLGFIKKYNIFLDRKILNFILYYDIQTISLLLRLYKKSNKINIILLI